MKVGVQMPDGAWLNVLLCKDAEQLNHCLTYLQSVDPGTELYLAHAPDKYHLVYEAGCQASPANAPEPAGQKRTKAECRLCKKPVLYRALSLQQQVYCSCTFWILPTNAYAAAIRESLDSDVWQGVVRMARDAHKRWQAKELTLR